MKNKLLNFKLKDQENINQLNSESILTRDSLNSLIDLIFPIGSVIAYSAEIINNPHFMICNGDEISRAKYNKLFTLIGITYGEGDGETTFNLPNLTGKFLEGALNNFGQYINPGLPNITGSTYLGWGDSTAGTIILSGISTGSLYTSNQYVAKAVRLGNSNANSNSYHNTVNIDASRSSNIYGASNTVQPPALTMNYIIRVL